MSLSAMNGLYRAGGHVLGQPRRPNNVSTPATATPPQPARLNSSTRLPRPRQPPEPAGSGWDAAPAAPTFAAKSEGNAWGDLAPVEAFSIADMLCEGKLLAEAKSSNATLLAKLEALQDSLRLKERLLVSAGACARVRYILKGTRAKQEAFLPASSHLEPHLSYPIPSVQPSARARFEGSWCSCAKSSLAKTPTRKSS
jgi:hypothetical protein